MDMEIKKNAGHPYTNNTKISEVIQDPVFQGHGRLMFPTDRSWCSGNTLGQLRLMWYGSPGPDKAAEIANYFRTRAEAGNTIFYDIYILIRRSVLIHTKETPAFFSSREMQAGLLPCAMPAEGSVM